MKRIFNIFSLAMILVLMVNLVGVPTMTAHAADADTDFGSFNVNWTSPICHYFTVKNNGATNLSVSVSGPTCGSPCPIFPCSSSPQAKPRMKGQTPASTARTLWSPRPPHPRA